VATFPTKLAKVVIPVLSGWSHFKMASFEERLPSVVEGSPVPFYETEKFVKIATERKTHGMK